MSASNDQFLRALHERHSAVILALEEAVIGAPSGTLETNFERATVFVDACKYLDAILAPPDKPAWLNGALGCGIPFVQNKSSPTQAALFKWLHHNGHIIRQQIVPSGDGAIQPECIAEVLPVGYLVAKPTASTEQIEDQSSGLIIDSGVTCKRSDNHKAQ